MRLLPPRRPVWEQWNKHDRFHQTELNEEKQNSFSVLSRSGMCYVTAGDANNLKRHCIKRFFPKKQTWQRNAGLCTDAPKRGQMSRGWVVRRRGDLRAGLRSSALSSQRGEDALIWVACPRRSTGARSTWRALRTNAGRALKEKQFHSTVTIR